MPRVCEQARACAGQSSMLQIAAASAGHPSVRSRSAPAPTTELDPTRRAYRHTRCREEQSACATGRGGRDTQAVRGEWLMQPLTLD